jgi:hypothetical protein
VCVCVCVCVDAWLARGPPPDAPPDKHHPSCIFSSHGCVQASLACRWPGASGMHQPPGCNRSRGNGSWWHCPPPPQPRRNPPSVPLASGLAPPPAPLAPSRWQVTHQLRDQQERAQSSVQRKATKGYLQQTFAQVASVLQVEVPASWDIPKSTTEDAPPGIHFVSLRGVRQSRNQQGATRYAQLEDGRLGVWGGGRGEGGRGGDAGYLSPLTPAPPVVCGLCPRAALGGTQPQPTSTARLLVDMRGASERFVEGLVKRLRPRLNVKGVDKAEKATLKAGLDEDAACTLALAVAADGLLSWLRTESGAVSRAKVNGAFVAMAHGVLLRGDRARAPIPSAATLDRVQSRQSRQADAPASQPEDPAAPAPPPQGPAAPPAQAPPPQPAPAPAPPPGPPANTPATPPAQRPLFSGFGTRSHHTAALSLALKLLPAQAFQHDKLPSCRSVRVWGAWGGGWVRVGEPSVSLPGHSPLPPPPPTHPPSRITPFPPLQSQDLRQVWAVKGSRSGLVPGGRPRARSRSLGVPGHGGVWRWPSSPPRTLGAACAAAG